jgi:hypothetical protein
MYIVISATTTLQYFINIRSVQEFAPHIFVQFNFSKCKQKRLHYKSITVLSLQVAPPIIQRCSQEFLNSPSSLHRNHTQSNP